MSKTRIAFIGAGNMAASLIGGLRAKGLDAAQIRASDPGAETRAKVSAEHGIEVFADNADAIEGADVIVLAVKPQAMKAVCEAIRPSLKPHQLVVSIAAGITCASMNNWLGAQPIVRCMPNTPALLRQGVSGLFATAEVTAEQRQQAAGTAVRRRHRAVAERRAATGRGDRRVRQRPGVFLPADRSHDRRWREARPAGRHRRATDPANRARRCAHGGRQ